MTRPASYRFRKFARRHKALAGGIVATCLALAIGLIGTSFGLLRATASAGREQLAHQMAAEEAERASLEAAQAQAVLGFLQEMLAAPDPGKDGHSILVTNVLRRAARTIGTEMTDQPEREAILRHTIGSTYIGLGLYMEAQEQLQVSHDLRSRLYGIGHPETINTATALALAMTELGDLDEAEQLVRQAIESYESQDLTDPLILTARDRLAYVLTKQGQPAEAERLWQLNLNALEDGELLEHPLRAKTLNSLGQLLNRL